MVNSSIRIGSVIVSFVINAAALAALFRFLTGTSLRWRVIWPGALLGGAALTVLQFGAGLLLSYTPSNPLLATFAIFVGLLLWFKISGIIMLVAAAWIAVASKDRDIPILAADRGRANRRRAQGTAAGGAGPSAHGARGSRRRPLVPRVARRTSPCGKPRTNWSGSKHRLPCSRRPPESPCGTRRSQPSRTRRKLAAAGACQGRSIGWHACHIAFASPRSTSTESGRRSATA